MQLPLLLTVVLGFLVGVASRTLFEVSLPTVLLILFLATVMVLGWRRNSVAVSPSAYKYVAIFLIMSVLGIARMEVATWRFVESPLSTQLGEEVTVEGVLVREPDYRESTVHLKVRVGKELVLVSTDRLNDLAYGDLVRVTGKLKQPEAFETDLGRIFNYHTYLLAQGIQYRIYFASVERIDSGYGNPVISRLLEAKTGFVDSMESVLPEPQAGLGSGLLLGVKSALGEKIETDFRRTGIIHIVVLSGYNVMLVVSFIMFCFSFFFSLRVRVVMGIVAIVVFALVVGLSATVVRASIMAVLVLIAQAFGRSHDVLRGLLIAGLIMILINPYLLLYDIGFQLSFVATLGLILIVPQFEHYGFNEHRWFGVREFFLATVSTQIAVLPLLMYYIGEISVSSFVVNVLVLPMVPVAMLLTFITGLLGLVYMPLALVLGFLANMSLLYIIKIASWFAQVPFSVLPIPDFSVAGVFFMYGIMFVVWYLLSRRKVKESDSYADWIIEIENESKDDLNTKNKDLPVFFR